MVQTALVQGRIGIVRRMYSEILEGEKGLGIDECKQVEHEFSNVTTMA